MCGQRTKVRDDVMAEAEVSDRRREGTRSQGLYVAPEVGRDKETDFPLEFLLPPEGTKSANLL